MYRINALPESRSADPMRCEASIVRDESVAWFGYRSFSIRLNSITGFCVNISISVFLREFWLRPFSIKPGVAVSNPEKPDNELELLRTALSLDHTLFTVQRHTSRPKGHVRVDCYASKDVGSPGLTRITSLVAGVLNYRRNRCGLIINNKDDVDYNLLVELSNKLKLDLKHHKLNSNSQSCPMLFF